MVVGSMIISARDNIDTSQALWNTSTIFIGTKYYH